MPQPEAAFTLVEVLIATTIMVLFMSGMFALNTQAFQLLRSSQGVIAAEGSTRDILDKMRNTTFDSQTDAVDITRALSGNTFPALARLEVVVQVTAFPAPASPAMHTSTVIVTRNASGTISTVKAGDGTLSNEQTIMTTVTSTWSARGQTRTHQAYMLSTQGGSSGRND
ncbi:MAG TPA: prepilin-type N-terminal cleavage/methylation domain-containing protein [Chthoniobacterales bacterium]